MQSTSCPKSFTCKWSLCSVLLFGFVASGFWHTINSGPSPKLLSEIQMFPWVMEFLQLWFCRIGPFTGGVNVGECKLKALYVCLGVHKLIRLMVEPTLSHPWWEVGTGHIFQKWTHSQTAMPYLHHFTFKEESIYLPLRGGRNESWWDRMMLFCSCSHYMAASESNAGFSEVLCIPRQHPKYGQDNNLYVYSECFEEF